MIQAILLNGSSSAGKTTLSKAIQDVMPDPWFHLALDQFRDGMPGRYRGLNAPPGAPGAEGLNVVPVRSGDRILTEVRFGALGKRMLEGMRQAIAAFIRAGHRVIIDDLMLDSDTLRDYALALEEFEAIFIGVRCPLDVARERESRRLGRFPGTAESHFQVVHAHGVYDLEVDTAVHSPSACAMAVKQFVESNPRPKALAVIRQRPDPQT